MAKFKSIGSMNREFDFVKGQCDFCEVIKIYKFYEERCLEKCEVCGDTYLTTISRVEGVKV